MAMRWTLTRLIMMVSALMALVSLSGCASTTATGVTRAPTATPTESQHFATLARQAIGNLAQNIVVAYDAEKRMITVTVTVPGPGSAAVVTEQERVKTICFQTQKALWTSGVSLGAVLVLVLGPVLDQYAEMSTQAYGAANLTAVHAAKLNWTELNPDAAWESYDSVWLRPDYDDAG